FGIETRLDTPRKQLHNKLFVADRRRVLLGSTNLSANSMDNNNETNVLVESPAVGEFFARYFEQLWKNSEAEPVLEAVEIPGAATVVNRGHFPVLEKMIAGARQRVWVMVYGMNYSRSYPDSKANALIDALILAAGKGLDVRVILDLSDYNQGLNRLNRETAELLKKGGVDVRFDREDVTTHAKLVLADQTALVGSANWGYQALEVRNESSLMITDPAAVAFFGDYFTEIWNGRIYPPPTPVPAGPAATPSPAPEPTPPRPCPGK
ncbi:MAG TPA: phospholipase D-like domain-containing protein, partial [bacterium]|nr:phospholipase D-like domain-containing protein [bacterium]